ncbi:MAG: hypothetical protein N3B01_01515 [Verrucomicrobiae bacterium]|nr:hypothetical protein [Verrucomicrobiae bacterium]
MKWFYLVALSLWLGSRMFLTVAVVPAISKALESDHGERLRRLILPRCYLLGVLCALAGVVCVGWLLAERVFGRWPGVLSLLLAVSAGGADLWLWLAVLPRLNELYELKRPVIGSGKLPEPQWEQEWSELRRMSLQVNWGVVAAVLALLFLVVFGRVL